MPSLLVEMTSHFLKVYLLTETHEFNSCQTSVRPSFSLFFSPMTPVSSCQISVTIIELIKSERFKSCIQLGLGSDCGKIRILFHEDNCKHSNAV